MDKACLKFIFPLPVVDWMDRFPWVYWDGVTIEQARSRIRGSIIMVSWDILLTLFGFLCEVTCINFDAMKATDAQPRERKAFITEKFLMGIFVPPLTTFINFYCEGITFCY